MRELRIYAVLVVALVLGVVAFVLADDEAGRYGDTEDAPYLARQPLVAAGATFLLAVVGGAVVVIALDAERRP